MLRLPIALAAFALFCSSAALAQPAAPRPDVLTQLLSEVRELRLVLQRQGADTARIQLLISRLTIQETRVSRLARDLENVRDQLARTEMEQRQIAERLKEMETTVTTLDDPGLRQSVEQQIKVMKQQFAALRSEEQRLRGQEADLEPAYAAEQSRWVEISNRLDEIERALARP